MMKNYPACINLQSLKYNLNLCLIVSPADINLCKQFGPRSLLFQGFEEQTYSFGDFGSPAKNKK